MSWTKITVRSMQELRLSKWGVGWGVGVGCRGWGEGGAQLGNEYFIMSQCMALPFKHCHALVRSLGAVYPAPVLPDHKKKHKALIWAPSNTCSISSYSLPNTSVTWPQQQVQGSTQRTWSIKACTMLTLEARDQTKSYSSQSDDGVSSWMKLCGNCVWTTDADSSLSLHGWSFSTRW